MLSAWNLLLIKPAHGKKKKEKSFFLNISNPSYNYEGTPALPARSTLLLS